MDILFFSSLVVSTRDCFFEVFIPADFVGWASACFLIVFNVSSFFGDSVAIALESSNGLGVRCSLSVPVDLYRSASRLALILLRIASFAEKSGLLFNLLPLLRKVRQRIARLLMPEEFLQHIPSKNYPVTNPNHSQFFERTSVIPLFACHGICPFHTYYSWLVSSEVVFWKYICSTNFSMGFCVSPRLPESR